MKPAFSLPVSDSDRRHLLAIARGLLGAQADAEDVLHEAYLRAATAAPAEVDVPMAWLTAVIKNLAFDHLRRRRLELSHAEGSLQDASVPSAEHEAAARQLRALALRRLADTLQPAEAAMLLLREVFEFSHTAIAERAGKSEASCRQTVHRALLRLRRAPDSGREPEDRATADALYVLCLRALQTHSPAPLHAILATPMVSARATSAVTAAAVSASGPRGGVVQVEGGYALVLVHDGKLLCCQPLGPVAAAVV